MDLEFSTFLEELYKSDKFRDKTKKNGKIEKLEAQNIKAGKTRTKT
jgi:hypothetical protein